MKIKIKINRPIKVMIIIFATTLFIVSSFVIKNTFDVQAKVAAAISPCDSQANPIVTENCRTDGIADASVWDVNGAGDPSIQGFATDISVNKTGIVYFKIKT